MINAPNKLVDLNLNESCQKENESEAKWAERSWVEELRGDRGPEAQLLAFEQLGNYLFRVAWNYLNRRKGDVDILSTFTSDEIALMAQDFVQETLEKFVRDDFKILQQYRGEARFLSWAARVVTNRASEDLRKVEWKRRSPMPESQSVVTRIDIDPELTAVCSSVADVLCHCINGLPARYQRAFLGRVIEGESSHDIGNELNISANAVDLLVFRARPKLRSCLEKCGIDVDILEMFADSDHNDGSMQMLT